VREIVAATKTHHCEAIQRNSEHWIASLYGLRNDEQMKN
jgi:hypothetical protein